MAEIFEDIKQFEERLELPNDFYLQLLKEDDWSFVIKLSALVEAGCTHILAHKLRNPELEDSFAYLEQCNSKVGRVVLLRKLGAINNEQAKILNSLAALRNNLAHKVSNVNFTFSEFTDSLDKNQRKNYVRDFGHGLKDEIDFGDVKVEKHTFVLENPKISMWLTLSEVLACLYLEIEVTEFRIKAEILEQYVNLTRTSSGQK
ncbi:hypothetical protein EBB56_21400 [Halomonas sp. YLB-10]|uniref:hypothetical protein n=1 Tax=Halomonas sp. YLB-10 TaxID=2483111 RepID=UPI000F5F8889|nr:hypothetical protein [Halomonas sp. YLB-10]RQW68679.1 hypothetical protein EBB56_21400 [Halomonas sp. YLB-10]